MTTMLMSNPLPLAVLGNPRGRRVKRSRARGISVRMLRYSSARAPGIRWSGRRGHLTTNPKGSTMSRRRHHRTHRRNPGALAGYVSAAKAAPGQVLGLFKGPDKIKHGLFTAGGAVGTYLLGGIVAAKLVAPLLSRVPVVNGLVASPMGARVVGGLLPFTVGYFAGKFVKNPNIRKALLVGGAVASILELVMPGKVGQWVARIPGVPMMAQAAPAVAAPAIKGPTSGMDGYVSAPSYAGVGDDSALAGYVSAPSYAGVGDGDELDGYVSAPSYAGVGDEDALAGAEDVMAGVGSYIDQAQNDYKSYLAD